MATWNQIDFEDSVWHLPAEIMKMRRPHDVPLCAAARGILDKVSKLTGSDEGFIFASPDFPSEPMSENTLNAALDALGYKGLHTAHGFRSSASTILNDRGVAREKVIEFQLAHLEKSETKRAYNRASYWDERVKLMADWSQIIAELKAKEARSPRKDNERASALI